MSSNNINNNKPNTPPPVDHAKNDGTSGPDSPHNKGGHDKFSKDTSGSTPAGQKPKPNPLLPGENANEPEGKKAHHGHHGHHGTDDAGTGGAPGSTAAPPPQVKP